MAERRMFAKTIIDSDAFLDMPQSSQLLYFHLSMRADDEGFINNPRAIMRNVRCTEEDILQLINKKFIIPFDNGIVVIKHWKIHNYIRNDRFKETKYLEEKATIFLDENKAYTQNKSKAVATCIQSACEMAAFGIPTDNQMDTQVRIGKDSIVKNSVKKENIKERKNHTYDEILSNVQNDSLRELYLEYIKMRKMIKSPMTDRALTMLIAKVDKLEPTDIERKKKLLETAILNNWKSVYPLKEEKEQEPVKYKSYDLEAFERMLNAKDNPPPTVADDPNIKAKAEALQKKLAKKH